MLLISVKGCQKGAVHKVGEHSDEIESRKLKYRFQLKKGDGKVNTSTDRKY